MMSEMGSVSPNFIENMFHITIYNKKNLWAMDQSCFPILRTAAILNFDIQLVSLEISFGMVLQELLYQRGPLHHDLK